MPSLNREKVYFNDNEKYVAVWLRNLYPKATVDESSIKDIDPAWLRQYRRCHFFAGIGGWEYALAESGWPSTHPVWTGSCPCQPFSVAGKGAGIEDEQHLWPDFLHLIRDAPESVAGTPELLCREAVPTDGRSTGVGQPANPQGRDDNEQGRKTDESGSDVERRVAKVRTKPGGYGEDGWVGNAHPEGRQGRGVQSGDERGQRTPWSASHAVWCADGRYRRVEPGICPLAHGVPARAPKLRAYGNAIVPQVAAVFIKAFMESVEMVEVD